MAKKTMVGIDQDSGAVRGARLSYDEAKGGKGGASGWKLLSFEEVADDLSDAVKLSAALKKLKDKLGVSATDVVSTCLSGKQTYAAQLEVKKLPDSEMAGMLKLELRKSMPFEASAATFDFAFLPVEPNRPRDAGVQVIVSAVSNALLSKHLLAYERAGMKPNNVNVLPVSAANAFWASRKPNATADVNETHVLLHVGSDTCTLVIDGSRSPFFTRSFSFGASDVLGGKGDAEATSQSALQLNVLSSELTKSVAYYKNTYANQGVGNISTITVIGNDASNPLFETLGAKTGYTIQTIETARTIQSAKQPEAGKYDLAIAVAMQAA